MSINLDDTVLNTSIQFVRDNNNVTIHNVLPVLTNLENGAQNNSAPNGCVKFNISAMDYLPWDNPDNLVNAEVEQLVYTIKNNMLGVLFLIGGPANIINMAVFYKQGLKDRVNLCLFALSFTDGLFLLVFLLLNADQLYLQFTTKERFGPMETFLINVNFGCLLGLYTVSPIISTIIALERCYCVLRPLKIQTLMRTRTMAATLIVVYVLVLSLFYVVSLRDHVGCMYDPESRLVVKTIIAGDLYKQHKQFIDLLDGSIFGLGLPLSVLTVVITSTIITVIKLRQIVTWRAGTSSSLSPREVALTKMLVGNSILFTVFVSPIALMRCSWLIFPEINSGRRHHNLYLTCHWISAICADMNATFNFFVYYTMGSRFRDTFWSMWRNTK